ncbi:DUF805 domain-containing protein [uncultured Microbacterium sp.]|uniref:DUF805 domain-containing protein n=1 Tax=uncultured Microbacterium sp. TaxID=191216 RepID=UPI0025EF29A7|nr:DUF805 domain-containing protein [uncultured Microbacterium sp.]
MTPTRFAHPRALPLPGASPRSAIARAARKSAELSGRASRSEYWWWILPVTVVHVALLAPALAAIEAPTAAATGTELAVPMLLDGLWLILTLVPTLSVTVRRLHDTNRSAVFLLLAVVPLGPFFLAVLLAMPSDPRGARFDAGPV